MPPPFYTATLQDIQRVAQLLASGEVVAIPTETVYGLAADALNPTAVRRIFEIKGRPLIDPLIVHVGSWTQLEKLALPVTGLARLAEKFWPGPLTVVLPKHAIVPDLVTAGGGTVAIRMPRHPVMRAVLKACGKPLAAPSANPFGYISPTRAEHVRESLGERAPHILDGGPCDVGVESTIVDLTKPGRAELLRPGPVTPEALEEALGMPVTSPVREQTPADNEAQRAPGMLTRHYSPRTPLVLFPRGARPPAALKDCHKAACIFQARPAEAVAAPNIEAFWFSEDGSPDNAARNVFHLLRTLDEQFYELVAAELAENAGLGLAINDRLRRAAAKAQDNRG